MRKVVSLLTAIALFTFFASVVRADEIKPKYPKNDVRSKALVWHIVPLSVGLTPLTDRTRYGNDWLHSVQFTACKTGIFRTCGLGVTFGSASDKPDTFYNPLDPLGPLTLANNPFTVAVSFPVTTRLWAKAESDGNRSFEINLNTSPYYDLRLKHWTVAYGLSAGF